MATARKSQPLVVTRYARSRLYDGSHGRYVTVEELRKWMASGLAFSVRDADTGDDITRILPA